MGKHAGSLGSELETLSTNSMACSDYFTLLVFQGVSSED